MHFKFRVDGYVVKLHCYISVFSNNKVSFKISNYTCTKSKKLEKKQPNDIELVNHHPKDFFFPVSLGGSDFSGDTCGV